MSLKKYLIFDFDWVLFNNQPIWQEVVDLSEGNNMIFTPKLAEKIDWQKINIKDLVYPHVFDLLDKAQKKGYQLLLFSEGNIDGQLYKLKISQLDRFFPAKQRFIFSSKKIEQIAKVLENIPDQSIVWYLDDKPSYLRDVKKKHKKVKTVLVCQGPWWQYKTPGFKPDYKIKRVAELLNLI
jgi:hypothetical protein